MQPCRASRPSKHSIGVCGLVGHNLQHVPVLHDLTLFIELEDVDSGPHVITGPILATMKDHIVTFGDYPFEFHTLAGIIAGRLLEIGDVSFLPVSYTRIVLDVTVSRVPLDRFARATFVEHEVVERHHVLLVALQFRHGHHSLLTAWHPDGSPCDLIKYAANVRGSLSGDLSGILRASLWSRNCNFQNANPETRFELAVTGSMSEAPQPRVTAGDLPLHC